MVLGFIRYEDGLTATLETAEALETALDQEYKTVWVDLRAPSEEELVAVAGLFNLDPEAIEDCMSDEVHPRLDEFDTYLFLLLYGAIGEEEKVIYAPRVLAVFMGERFIVTVHKERLRSIHTMKERCRKHPDHILDRGTDFFLFTLIDMVVDNYGLVVDLLEEELDALEDASFDPVSHTELLGGLSAMKKKALHLRRILASQRELIEPLARGEFDYISPGLEVRFRHVRDHLTLTLDLIENLRDMLNEVRNNYNAVLSNRMNNIMKTLTLFSAVLMPMGVIVGLYGMNVPLWPNPDNPATFWGLIGFMVLVAGGLFTFFYSRRWL